MHFLLKPNLGIFLVVFTHEIRACEVEDRREMKNHVQEKPESTTQACPSVRLVTSQ